VTQTSRGGVEDGGIRNRDDGDGCQKTYFSFFVQTVEGGETSKQTQNRKKMKAIANYIRRPKTDKEGHLDW
jgi:hypothetical protein